VIGFRDCVIKDEVDCDGSGENAARQVTSVLNDPPALRAIVVVRPAEAKEELDDVAAAAYGKSNGYAYVADGEVLDYHRAMIFSAHAQRLSLTMRVLRTSDGQVVDSYSCTELLDNLTSLNSIIRSMTDDLRDSLEGITHNGFVHFLLGRQSCDQH
jgi:hypothetical protein